MAKAPSPLLGYNNNVRHKNRVFHVQTEDSGVKHPHIITHLFMDGGRILKSIKKSYAEFVGTETMSDVVRNMMKDQHKEMLIALRDGQFDHLVDPKAVRKPSATDMPAVTAPPAAATSQRPPSVPPPAPQKQPSIVASGAPPAVVATAKAPPFEEAPATTRTPAQSSGQELTLDIDALERAAKDAETTSPMFASQNDLPPPPQNLFRDKSVTGQYRTLTPAPEQNSNPPSRPPPSQRKPGSSPPRKGSNPPPPVKIPGSSPPKQMPPFAARPPAKPTPAARPGEGRYAPARPAAIFGQARPQSAPSPSLFGEDLISDKSLDEVILSYLAEDLEPADKKKR